MGGIKDLICFIRVGTLDYPERYPPDAHICTISKQPWVNLPPNVLVYEKFYDFEKVWTSENNEFRKSLLANTNPYKKVIS